MPARYEILAGWANTLGWTRGAELGVSDGRTHIYLLEHCPQLHLIGVDIWDLPGVVPGATVSGEKCLCRYCSETKAGRRAANVRQREAAARAGAGRVGRSTLYKMPASEAAALVGDGSLDFVFVDADHSLEGVRDDIAAWLPKLKPEGRMSGHDWNMAGVRAGVLHHFAQREIEVEDDHVWWAAR